MIPFYKIKFSKKDWNFSIDITDIVHITDKHAIKNTASQLTFSVIHPLYKYVLTDKLLFEEGDSVQVYMSDTAINTSTNSQLVMSAEITRVKQKLSTNASIIEIECMDKTRLLLNRLWANSYDDKIDEIIKNIVAHANDTFDGTFSLTTNNVATTRSDGSDFPTVKIAKIYKTIYEWIEELSQPEYTGEDKAYLFYVDKDNDLHFEYPESTASATLDLRSAEVRGDVEIDKGDFGVINMVIFNAGEDKNGNGVLWYYYDSTTESSELRVKYVPMTDLSRDYKADFPSSYASMSNSDYRTTLKNLGVAQAQKIIARSRGQTYKVKIPLQGTNSYHAGDLLKVTIPKHGFYDYLLRVKEVTQTVDATGWRTTLELIEDEKVITS